MSIANRSDAAQGLTVEGLKVSYAGVPAVRGVDIRVAAGEAVGLIGPNGAGKSSTLLAIMGAVERTGRVLVHGQDIAGLPPERVVRTGVALVPEGRHVFADLTVSDNLRLGAVGRREKAGAAETHEQVLELFPMLRDFGHRHAGLLSGGQQQQLAIGRALMSNPDILLLDEPSLGLSPTAVDTVFEALDVIRAEGRAVLVVEQRAEFTIAFCDRTFVLHDGLITLGLKPEDAEKVDVLTKAYFG
ncbi:MAG: ABC transporter ATP-binding protein [Actinobacteria bacterium]|nr:ABC transporter ATP-binding protein [Actinomycetota bacterium]